MKKQLRLNTSQEIMVDLFAGGGGASSGIEQATGRMVDIAINHDREAVAMHAINHPTTRHLVSDVFEADPRTVTEGQPVGLLWASPDCKHHSKAKGGKPRDKNIRSLAWVVVRWAKRVRPRVIFVENVEEFRHWGPLDDAGFPIKAKKGQTFNIWTQRLEHLGYRVEHRELKACDFGAPTTRKRLFIVARRDGLPIRWPEPTHGNPAGPNTKRRKLKPWRTAAEGIDWSLPCPSIFERARPLADATCRRIAKGIMRYVVNAADPFIVPLTHQGGDRVYPVQEPLRTVTGAHRGELALVAPVLTEHANASSPRCNSAAEPLRTVCAEVKGGHHALVAAHVTKFRANSTGTAIDEPLHTVTAGGDTQRPAGNGHAMGLVSAFITKHYGGNCSNPASALDTPLPTVTAIDHHSLTAVNLVHMGHGEQSADGAKRWSHGVRDIGQPLNTVTASGTPAGLVASHLVKLRRNSTGQDQREPLHTLTNGGHFAEVRAFLIKYYGMGGGTPSIGEPLDTITSRDRFGLVTVHGQDYAIVDIGLRMLSPRELFRAQGFPDSYVIDRGADGRVLTKTAQVRMVGNSVCPPIAAALVRANYREIELERVA